MGKGSNLLYGQPLSTLKWGVSPGSHVAHIVTNSEPTATEILTTDEPSLEISQNDIYVNEGDNSTAKYFKQLVENSAKDFEADYADEQFQDYLYTMRDYVTASSRSRQKELLVSLREQQAKYIKELNKRIKDVPSNPTAEQLLELDRNKVRLERMNEYSSSMTLRQDGNLEIPEETEKQLMLKPVTNPKKRYHLGVWVKDDSPLFPHEPSPNDIKQGVGVQDCFMLSALSGIAAKNPQKIKDAMKDNHDGTVTVRFYNKADGNKPVFIRVEKSANKLVGTGNLYASTSLWVQMLEKAYVKFVNEIYSKTKRNADLADGYNAINRATTEEFMDAFGEEEYKKQGLAIGSGLHVSSIYRMDANGDLTNHPPGYLPCEKEYFDFLSEQVKDPNAVITVGTFKGPHNHSKIDYALSKGIRAGHAYTLLNTFEKVVDGEKKKFVTLRDPYGVFATGYGKDGRLENRSSAVSGTFSAGTDTMGTFNMEYKDFLKIFATVIGVPEKAGRKFLNEHIEKWFDYDMQPDSHPDLKKDYREFVNEADLKKQEEQPAEQVKEDAAPENEINAPEQNQPVNDNVTDKIYEMVKSPEGLNNFKKNLTDLCKDINNTDEWFVWTNTKEFNKMRDDAFALRDQLNKMTKDGRTPDEKELKDLSLKIAETGRSSKKYAENKSKTISDNRLNGKEPSVRAKHRLAAAVNLLNVCSAKEPTKPIKNKEAEDIGIKLGDLNERIKMQEAGQKIPHDNKSIEEAGAEIKNVMNQIKTNPNVIKEGNIADDFVIMGEENVKKVDSGKIKTSEAKLQVIDEVDGFDICTF